MQPEMTNQETATHIRQWVENDIIKGHSIWAWPTDPCGYNQHIRFVRHRNANWNGDTREDWHEFCLDYARMIESEPDGERDS